MATKGRKKKSRRAQRRKHYFPKRRKVVLRPPIGNRNLRYVEDRRTYRPNWIDGHKLTDGRPAVYVATQVSSSDGRAIRLGFSKVGFKTPHRTIVCKRRKRRRRALFAKNIIGAGRGSKGFAKRKLTEMSEVRC